MKNKANQRKPNGHVIHYNILTKLTLFRNYLKSSESVKIHFSSGTSNIEIGWADLPIPSELIAFIDKQSNHSVHTVAKFRTKCQIFNAQDRVMGEICAEYDLVLYDRVFNENEMDSDNICTTKCSDNLITTQPLGIENNMNHFNLDLDTLGKSRKNMPKEKLSAKSVAAERPKENPPLSTFTEKIPTSNCKRLASKSSRSLLSYLTGRPLDAVEENEAVKAMESTSPTESLIDLLSFDLNGLYLPKKPNDPEANVLKKIDCLRLHVYDLCLTRAGTREILSKNEPNECSFSSGTFTGDVDLDAILSTRSPFEKNTAFTSKVTRIFSSSIEAMPPCKFESTVKHFYFHQFVI